jgi:hypothetical protein
MKNLKKLYNKAKAAKVGEAIKCPNCGTEFVKNSYQQAFCKTKGKTVCKDGYWNKVTPNKRNNVTRISPASAEYLRIREERIKRLAEIEEDIMNMEADIDLFMGL